MKVISGEPESITPKIEKYIEDAKNSVDAVSKAVDNFISSSKKELEGEDFNRVRWHMQAYCDTLDNATKLLVELPDIVSSANSTMQNYCNENNWKSPADEDNIPEAQLQYDKAVQLYNVMKSNECTQETPITDKKGIVIGTDHNGKYHAGEINRARENMELWKARLRYLQQMKPTDTNAYNECNSKVLEIVTQTNARCDDIVVMNISGAINEIINSDSLSNDEKMEAILSSVKYPAYISEISESVSKSSGYWGQWKSWLNDYFGAESWKKEAENYSNDFTGALLSDFKGMPNAFGDLVNVFLGNYH